MLRLVAKPSAYRLHYSGLLCAKSATDAFRAGLLYLRVW